MTLCSLMHRCQCLWGTSCLRFQGRRVSVVISRNRARRRETRAVIQPWDLLCWKKKDKKCVNTKGSENNDFKKEKRWEIFCRRQCQGKHLTGCWEEHTETAVSCATLVSVCQITWHHFLDVCVCPSLKFRNRSEDLRKGRNNEDRRVVAITFVWKITVSALDVKKNVIMLKWYTDNCSCFLSAGELDKIVSLPTKIFLG